MASSQTSGLVIERKILRYCVAEVFANSEKDKGIRVSGDDVSVRILSALAQGSPSSSRLNDERGWFCCRYITVAKVLTLFRSHGWDITNMYQMPSYHPFAKGEALADFILMQKMGFIADDVEKLVNQNQELVDASGVHESVYEGSYNPQKDRKLSFFGKSRSKQHYLTEKRQLSLSTTGSERSGDQDEYEMEEMFGPPLFGIALKYLPQNPYGVPIFVEDVIDFLNTDENLRQEGLFRLSASTVVVQEVKKRLDRGERVNFATVPDVNVPAGLLKMFLKTLPESLIPHSLADLMGALADISEESERIKYLSWMLQNYLPDQNYSTLKHIVGFLSNVGIYSQYNKMTAGNLALIFGPNLMWTPDDPLGGAMGSMKGLNIALQLMIVQFEKVFESVPEIRKYEDAPLSPISSDDEGERGAVNGSVDLV